MPFIARLYSKGKLSKHEVKSALDRVATFKSDPHHTVFVEKFTKGRPGSVSPNLDGAVVGGNLSSGPLTMFGHEENVRSYSLFYDRFSNRSVELRLMERPIYVREHAISRHIERAGSAYGEITGSLWPGLLVIDALEYFGTPAIARVFMVPVPKGAFLGVSALFKPPGDIKGVETAKFDVDGVREAVDRSSVEPLMPLWFLNTFVSEDELKENQIQAREALLKLIERHRSVLMVAHLARVMSLKDKLDDLGLEDRFRDGDVQAAKNEFEVLFNSSLWTGAIRVPNDSPFVQAFVAQGLLERTQLRQGQVN